MNKKGGVFNRETMFIAIGVLVGAVAIFGMLDSAAEVLDTEALFKKYIATDIALIMGVVYAAPGNVTYEYPMPPTRTYYVKVGREKVEVSSDGGFGKGETFSYRIAYDESVEFTPAKISSPLPEEDELVNRPIKMIIRKSVSPSRLPEQVVTVNFER